MRVLAVFLLELSRAARRERTYWLRTLYCATVSTVVALLWTTQTGDGSWEQQQSIGRTIFVFFAWVQFALLNLAAPVSLCSAISEERNLRTLPALLSTRLSNMQIVIGKLSGGMISVGLLLLAGLPIMFLLLVFGGLSPEVVIATFALTVTCAAVGGAAALFFSSLVRTNYAAFLLTLVFLWVFAFYFRPEEWLGFSTKNSLVNSFQAFYLLINHESQVVRLGEWLQVIGFSTVAILLLALATALPLRWNAAREKGLGLHAVFARLQGLGKRTLSKKRRGLILDYAPGENAITRREAVSLGHAFWSGLRLVMWGGALLFAIILFGYGQEMLPRAGKDFNGHLDLLPKLLAFMLMAPLVAGGRAFSYEKERDTFLVLLAAPIKSHYIIMGKLRAILMRLSPLLLIPLIYTAGFAMKGVLPWRVVVIVCSQWLVYGFFLVAVGIGAGLLVRKTARAVGITFGVALGMNFLLWAAWGIGSLFITDLPIEPALSAWWVFFSWSEVLDAKEYTAALGWGLGLNLLAHFLAGVGVTLLSIRFFDRLVGRVS